MSNSSLGWLPPVIILVALACMAVLLFLDAPAMAAPDVPPCEAINSAGNIIVYRCEPDEGLPYLINSVGFMAVEE